MAPENNPLIRSPRFRWALALLAVLAVAAASFLMGRASSPSAAAAVDDATNVGAVGEQARRQADDPLAIGAVDAPVVMVMFSDFRCPFCARFSQVTEPVLVENYVEDGLLRIEWRDLPVFGEPSLIAARAGRAAAEQGRFWEYSRALYEAAPDRGYPDLTPARLRDFAVQVDMPDLERFERDISSDRFDAAIAEDVTQARSLGLSGTPSFVIGGDPVVGAQPTEIFENIIGQALASSD